MRETLYLHNGATRDFVRCRYLSRKLLRIALRDEQCADPQTYYIQFDWHGNFYRYVRDTGEGGTYGTATWGNYATRDSGSYAYLWNGAWGYLYFYGVFGGTNTVRSVDLYYIHGRWWHPDMGLFLSPNEKGD